MAHDASRRGAVEMGTLIMILALGVMLGFMYWLSGEVVQERELAALADTVPEDTGPTVRTVSAAELQMDATPLEGSEIRVASFNVASTLGTQGFWLDIPNGNPFLVSMSAEVMASGIAVAAGASATVTGVVHAMSDSTLTAWATAGTIQDNDRIVAEFATHYLEATQVELAPGGGGAGAR